MYVWLCLPSCIMGEWVMHCDSRCRHSHHSCVGSIRFIWEKDGQVIVPQSLPRLRLDVNGTLHISQTWSGDIGTYTCRVTSVGGNDSRSAHLRVRSAMKAFSYHPLWFSPCGSLLIITFCFHTLSVNCVSLGFSMRHCPSPAFSVSFLAFLIRYSSSCFLFCLSVCSLSVFFLSFSQMCLFRPL